MRAIPDIGGESPLWHCILPNNPPLTEGVIVSPEIPSEELRRKMRRAQFIVEAWYYGNCPPIAVILEPEKPIAEVHKVYLFENVYLLKPSGFEALEDSDYMLMNKELYTVNMGKALQFKLLSADEFRTFGQDRSFVAAVLSKAKGENGTP